MYIHINTKKEKKGGRGGVVSPCSCCSCCPVAAAVPLATTVPAVVVPAAAAAATIATAPNPAAASDPTLLLLLLLTLVMVVLLPSSLICTHSCLWLCSFIYPAWSCLSPSTRTSTCRVIQSINEHFKSHLKGVREWHDGAPVVVDKICKKLCKCVM
jgi:hypothetical protein